MEKELELPTSKDLKIIPTDKVEEAIIIDLELSTWADITKNEEKKLKLNNPAGKILKIKYDAKGFIRQDIFPISDNPTTASKYGRYIVKYNVNNEEDFKPRIKDKIKVFFDADGRSDIIIAK